MSESFDAYEAKLNLFYFIGVNFFDTLKLIMFCEVLAIWREYKVFSYILLCVMFFLNEVSKDQDFVDTCFFNT